MSHARISRSPDLKRLRDEGYDVEISNTYLLINRVPYVSPKREVAYGTLISTLDLSNDVTRKPTDHVALWAGDHPCHSDGRQLVHLVNQTMQQQIRDGLVANYSFSQKPGADGYSDYYQKMTTYVRILEGEAHALDPSAKAKTFPVINLTDEESVFCYLDSASSRAGITMINDKLKNERIAIIGLGGTGAYILDLVAKTPVGEIHLFDSDDFLQHNAFRSPGAPSGSDLERKLTKVAWFAESYSRMRRKIIPHAENIDERNVENLDSMNFVFLSIDAGKPKQSIVKHLVQMGIPFIDVGMDLYVAGDTLGGTARITTITSSFHDHIERRINFSDGEDNEYSSNIQIADMNMLNAAFAVIKWKKMRKFYIDLGLEYHTLYSLSTNVVSNGEIEDET